MKVNLSQNLALKLASNDNYFNEELVGILLTEFKLFISNRSRFDLYFPLLKPENRLVFFFFWVKVNLSQNLALKLASNDNYFTEELVGIIWIKFKLFISNWKIWPVFAPAKAKKPSWFFLPFRQIFEWKHEIPVQIWPWTWTSVAQIFSSTYRILVKVQIFSSGYRFSCQGTDFLVMVQNFSSARYRFSRQVQKFSSSSENWWWKVSWSAETSASASYHMHCQTTCRFPKNPQGSCFTNFQLQFSSIFGEVCHFPEISTHVSRPCQGSTLHQGVDMPPGVDTPLGSTHSQGLTRCRGWHIAEGRGCHITTNKRLNWGYNFVPINKRSPVTLTPSSPSTVSTLPRDTDGSRSSVRVI